MEGREEKKVEIETGEEKEEDKSATASPTKDKMKRVDTPTVDKFKPVEDADEAAAAVDDSAFVSASAEPFKAAASEEG